MTDRSKYTNRFNPLYYLLFESRRPVRLVNTITFVRIVAFPVFIILLFFGRLDIFKWLLVISFLTDALDGYLARRFKATSILGSRMDSLGDDLTIVAAMVGLLVFRTEFFLEQWLDLILLFVLYLAQLFYAFIRYQKLTSFHTYLAKLAAVLQGVFLCSIYFVETPWYWLYYAALFTTALQLLEEIIMVAILRSWKADVRSMYHALYERNTEQS
jgi:phosphatidylglycerophosphate synthase